MKIAFIHNEKKLGTGAHFINDLISVKLREHGIIVNHFYPTQDLMEAPTHLKGISNILFFFSLLEHRAEILKCDLIQGTTYTPLTFLTYDIPVIAHFGSTTQGFLEKIPTSTPAHAEDWKFWQHLKEEGVLKDVNLKSRRPLKDIAEIEKLVASRAEAVIATSEAVKEELVGLGAEEAKVSVIHNALEDYWFQQPLLADPAKPSLVFLGRLGNDSFNLKLKGLDRLVRWYLAFPQLKKITVGITTNDRLSEYLDDTIPHHRMMVNVQKNFLPKLLNPLRGSIMFIPSRYEGFSLSLIEGMSQGLIPIVYSVGVAPEVIKNGVNGFLVKNEQEARSYTQKLLASSSLRKKMSEAAYQSALNFTADRMAEQFIAKYNEVLAAYKRPEKANGYRSYISRWLKK